MTDFMDLSCSTTVALIPAVSFIFYQGSSEVAGSSGVVSPTVGTDILFGEVAHIASVTRRRDQLDSSPLTGVTAGKVKRKLWFEDCPSGFRLVSVSTPYPARLLVDRRGPDARGHKPGRS
jgi:hypothetical protein